MSEQKGFMGSLQKVLMPIGNFLANEPHFASISAGLMSTVGISIIGAVFTIIKSPPVTAQIMEQGGILKFLFGWWYNLVNIPAVNQILSVPNDMTMGLIAVVAVFGIAYNLAKTYGMKPLSNGVTAMLMFIMVVAPVQTVALAGPGTTFQGLGYTFLGATGLFTAIIVALVSVEITRFCEKHNWIVKMPDVVPPFLQDSFSSMIPLLLNVVIIYGANVGLGMINPQLNLATVVVALLSAPLSAINSVPGIILLGLFGTLLWTMGVHGTMIVYPLIIPMTIEATMTNAALVAAGAAPVFSPVMLFGALALVGGTGNTMGFSLLCLLRAKSEQLKAIGKVSWVPGIFGVNEPVAFGAPTVFNPILAIPYVITFPILAVIMWVCYSIGLITPSYILIMSLMPIGVGSFLGSMDVKNFIFAWLMVPLSALIYYPFFKAYDNQLVHQEAEAKKAAA